MAKICTEKKNLKRKSTISELFSIKCPCGKKIFNCNCNSFYCVLRRWPINFGRYNIEDGHNEDINAEWAPFPQG